MNGFEVVVLLFTEMQRMAIDFEEQFEYVRINFAKFLRILGGSRERFNVEDYMMLYTHIYDISNRPYYRVDYQDLYDAYKEMITDYVRSTELPPLREKHDEFMLMELVERWDEHKLIVRWLSRCFQHLDAIYLTRARHPCLRETGLTIFRDLVFDEMHGKAKDAALNMINKERGGEYIDRSLLRNVSHIFVEIGMPNMERYEQNFEVHLLRVTAYYYALRAADWIVEDSCPDYMIKSEECLRKERERASIYLHASSEPKIVETVQYELLVVYATQLLEKEQSGCHALLRDDKVDDLSRMYRLYHKIPEGLNPVAAIFKQHITTEGTVLVQQAEDAASSQFFFRKLLELHEKSMEYVKGCFQNHELFHKALREAFEILCNKTVAGSSSAEMLATFCDNALKNDGSEKRRDEAISKTWEAIKFIAYISDKDLFAEFYEKKLVRRLLFSRSDNDDHEKSILEELKQYCGRHFTAIMEYTIETMASATENQANFERYLADNPTAQPGIDLSDKVLTSGFWRSFKSSHLSLLAEMVNMIRSCPENCLPGKFTWTHTLGTFRMVGQFDPRPIELIVTPYQAAVLLLFNSSDRLSYSEISTQSNLSQDELVRVLRSLSCNKYKILHKVPSSKTVSQTDHFEFNKKFTDRKTRIMIPLPSEHERKQIVEDVNTKRVPALDAALLRIMKFRNILDRQDLIMECVDQLSHMFKPDTEAIINRIEILISEEYLELDEENPILVRYLPRPFKWW